MLSSKAGRSSIPCACLQSPFTQRALGSASLLTGAALVALGAISLLKYPLFGHYNTATSSTSIGLGGGLFLLGGYLVVKQVTYSLLLKNLMHQDRVCCRQQYDAGRLTKEVYDIAIEGRIQRLEEMLTWAQNRRAHLERWKSTSNRRKQKLLEGALQNLEEHIGFLENKRSDFNLIKQCEEEHLKRQKKKERELQKAKMKEIEDAKRKVLEEAKLLPLDLMTVPLVEETSSGYKYAFFGGVKRESSIRDATDFICEVKGKRYRAFANSGVVQYPYLEESSYLESGLGLTICQPEGWVQKFSNVTIDTAITRLVQHKCFLDTSSS